VRTYAHTSQVTLTPSFPDKGPLPPLDQCQTRRSHTTYACTHARKQHTTHTIFTYTHAHTKMHTHNHTHAPQVFIQPLPDHQAPLHALALCTSLMRTQLPLLLPQASCLDQTPNTHAYQAQQVCRTKGGLQASLWPHTSVTGRT
jgi:hypothetical protein